MLSFSKLMQKRAPSPSSESFSKVPWLRNQWKVANPPTPTRVGHPLSQVVTAAEPPPPPIKAPEMARKPTTDSSERIRINTNVSESDLSKPWPTISTEEVAPSPEPHRTDTHPASSAHRPKTPHQDDSRWSWTNSQAPSTPRVRTRSPSRRASKSSMGSLSKFRRMHSRVRSQSEHASSKIPEERTSRATSKPPLPPLKNKASKPTLAPLAAPPPSRRLSKKSGPPRTSASRPSTGVGSQKKDIDSRPTTAG